MVFDAFENTTTRAMFASNYFKIYHKISEKTLTLLSFSSQLIARNIYGHILENVYFKPYWLGYVVK